MEKTKWIKPDFELEVFVPNNYISACCVTIQHTIKEVNLANYYIFVDNGNGVWDGGYFEGEGNDRVWNGPDQLIDYTPGDHDQGHSGHCMAFDYITYHALFVWQKDSEGNIIDGTKSSYSFVKISQTHKQDYYLRDPLDKNAS